MVTQNFPFITYKGMNLCRTRTKISIAEATCFWVHHLYLHWIDHNDKNMEKLLILKLPFTGKYGTHNKIVLQQTPKYW